MNFVNHYFTEVKSTPRKGIKHIYGGDDGKYSMSPEDFIEIINFIRNANDGILKHSNTHLSEKADGFSLKFGVDEKNKFYIESAHSGIIYDENKFKEYSIQKKGEVDKITLGYMDILKKLKHNSKLQDYLKSINTPYGIKIQTECFYLPIAKTSETDNSIVKFIATWYKKEKLGSWATFVVISVTDGKGRSLPQDEVKKIKEDLKKLSNNEIKFDYSDIPDFSEIDLNPEIKKIESFINTVEKEFGEKIDKIINDPSRQKSSLDKKRKIKQELLNLQKEFSKKLGNLIKTGKFGDEYEGLVFELANGIMFKVVSDRFKEAKKDYNMEYKK